MVSIAIVPVDLAWFGCHSELTWMCRLLFLAMAPSFSSRAAVQDGAKRGVTTGFTRGYWCKDTKIKVHDNNDQMTEDTSLSLFF